MPATSANTFTLGKFVSDEMDLREKVCSLVEESCCRTGIEKAEVKFAVRRIEDVLEELMCSARRQAERDTGRLKPPI